ncbi:LOW QUALITY PROTEIN: hypothetical protein TorRG33x02_219200 [Trema orientale]|uniref:Uncharacterized protein n=1 Tax=Trema orientale TaxID=63057 RepID=A0A2P5E9W1_TREOI|nr:LOW QUALITY PROTEIN: hypothetical protein TorRG33x02_219200 [Trema orientale]
MSGIQLIKENSRMPHFSTSKQTTNSGISATLQDFPKNLDCQRSYLIATIKFQKLKKLETELSYKEISLVTLKTNLINLIAN